MIDKLRKLLIKHEGKSNKVYLCTAKKRSIGIGHNIDAKGLPEHIGKHLAANGTITEQMIDSLFASDVMDAMRACTELYPQFNTFTEARKIALIDFVFNVGIGTANEFKATNRAINGGNWEAAAEGIRKSLYYRQLGGDPPGTDDGKIERSETICRMLRDG